MVRGQHETSCINARFRACLGNAKGPASDSRTENHIDLEANRRRHEVRRTTLRHGIGVLLASLLAMQNADAGDLKKGGLFSEARAELIEQGWRPVDTHARGAYDAIGVENNLLAAHIVEVESCAIDRPLCIFNYKRDKRCLRLVTQGEDVPEMRVQSWSSRCPDR